jgi:hypothetical protein
MAQTVEEDDTPSKEKVTSKPQPLEEMPKPHGQVSTPTGDTPTKGKPHESGLGRCPRARPRALPRLKQCPFPGGTAHLPALDHSGGGERMASPKELRQHVADFLKLAQSASREGRACLIAMAKVWTQDAEDIKRRNARRPQQGEGEHDTSSPGARKQKPC